VGESLDELAFALLAELVDEIVDRGAQAGLDLLKPLRGEQREQYFAHHSVFGGVELDGHEATLRHIGKIVGKTRECVRVSEDFADQVVTRDDPVALV